MNKEYKTFEELKEELGDKFEEFMYKANIKLLEKVNQLETNRDAAIEYIKKHRQTYDIDGSIEPKLDDFDILTSPKKLISILERGKE